MTWDIVTRMLRVGTSLVFAVSCLLGAPGADHASAQENVTLGADVLFYGDNTEFRNPFREGETLFGAAVRLVAAADVGERTTLAFGAFANQRFGSDDVFELVRPVIALTVRGRRSSFTLGTLPPPRHLEIAGPDLQGPHGLLPPLQRETLSFERAYEAGLQWRFTGSTLRHETWLNWQKLNTPEHRERFDAGLRSSIRLSQAFAVPIQIHIVHEGGQLFNAGPVTDSLAGAAGLLVRGRGAGFESAAIEGYVLGSRIVPDRGNRSTDLNGAGVLVRGSVQRAGWRGHLLFWRGKHFITDEGDPNYLSIRRDRSRYRGTRDYAELGLTRVFRLNPQVAIHAAARAHRTEKHYEYSYRILGVVDAAWKLK